jgi:AcrR family transcriptional regulator
MIRYVVVILPARGTVEASQEEPMTTRTEDTGDGRPAGRGRPRSPEVDEGILHAALALLDEVGLDGLTIEGVAKRAGVGKTTVYRRFDDKYALAAAALDRTRPTLQLPDTGSLHGDLAVLFRFTADALASQRLRQTFAMLVHAFAGDDRFRRAYWTTFVEPRRAQLLDVLDRARQRGELPPDDDLDLIVDIIASSIFYQAIRPSEEPFTDRLDRIVALLTDAAEPRAGS